MASRFESRIKRLESVQGEDVDSILDSLKFDQSEALLIHLLAHLEGEEGPTAERLRQFPTKRERYNAALASIPAGVQERFMAAFVARVQAQAK
jgi:hypothetical protein